MVYKSVQGSLRYFDAILVFLFSGFILKGVMTENSGEREASAILDRLLNNYDKRFRPNYGGVPVTIGLTAYALYTPEIDTTAMTMTLNMYFRQSWQDPRLKYEGNRTIAVDKDHGNRLWCPDTSFTNAINSKLNDDTTANTLIHLRSSGVVLRATHHIVQLSCPMDFKYFPFDEQICTFEIESFGHNMKDIIYSWAKGQQSIIINNYPATLREYQLCGHRTGKSEYYLSVGNYSRAFAEIWLCRDRGRYTIEYFLPCLILCVVSIATHLMTDVKLALFMNVAVLGFTILFLTLSTGFLEIPKSSVMNSMEVYAGITYVLVIFSVLTNTAAFYFSKGNLGPESIEMRDLEQNAADDQINLCPPQRETSSSFFVLSKFELVKKHGGDIFTGLLPLLKILMVASYVLANIIFVSIHPNAGKQDAAVNTETGEEWILA